MSYVRERKIVEAAARKIKSSKAIRDWLREDTENRWVKRARQYLNETDARARELGLSAAEVDDQIAGQLALLAMDGYLKSKGCPVK